MVSCQHVKVGTLTRLPWITRRKVGTTSNHHAPYVLGYKRATMAVTEGSEPARGSGTEKSGLSSDCGLQPAHMKLSLIHISVLRMEKKFSAIALSYGFPRLDMEGVMP